MPNLPRSLPQNSPSIHLCPKIPYQIHSLQYSERDSTLDMMTSIERWISWNYRGVTYNDFNEGGTQENDKKGAGLHLEVLFYWF